MSGLQSLKLYASFPSHYSVCSTPHFVSFPSSLTLLVPAVSFPSPLTSCCSAVPGVGTGMAQLECVCDLLLSERWCPGEQSRLAQLWHWQRIMVGGEFVLLHYAILQVSFQVLDPKFCYGNLIYHNQSRKVSFSDILQYHSLR